MTPQEDTQHTFGAFLERHRLFVKFNESIICEKGKRGHPLTDEQKEHNRQKSKVRSRVEHVFGFMEQTMGGLIFRGVGMMRAKANIALTNLVYNMCRLVQIKKYQPNLISIQ